MAQWFPSGETNWSRRICVEVPLGIREHVEQRHARRRIVNVIRSAVCAAEATTGGIERVVSLRVPCLGEMNHAARGVTQHELKEL